MIEVELSPYCKICVPLTRLAHLCSTGLPLWNVVTKIDAQVHVKRICCFRERARIFGVRK